MARELVARACSITKFIRRPLSAIKRLRAKPVWKGFTRESTQEMMRRFKTLVKTLASVLINEIGRQLRKSERSTFLGSKETDVPY